MNKIGNSNNPMQRSATASDITNRLAVVRSRRPVAMSQITSALPATAKVVGSQRIIKNHLCIFCTLLLRFGCLRQLQNGATISESDDLKFSVLPYLSLQARRPALVLFLMKTFFRFCFSPTVDTPAQFLLIRPFPASLVDKNSRSNFLSTSRL